MSKPRGSDDEILLLIHTKRDHAKAAMQKIVADFGLEQRVPSISLLLDYLSNMVYCIELMLKLLSSNWNSHDEAAMYATIYGQPHPTPDLLDFIGDAVKNQKYLFEPAAGLACQIPELENLYDQLQCTVRRSAPTFEVLKSYPAPISFAAYLRDNAARFYRKQCPKITDATPPFDGDTVKQEMIQEFTRELAQIQQTFDTHIGSHQTFDFFEGEISMT